MNITSLRFFFELIIFFQGRSIDIDGKPIETNNNYVASRGILFTKLKGIFDDKSG